MKTKTTKHLIYISSFFIFFFFLIIYCFEYLGLDEKIQNLFYKGQGLWMLEDSHGWWRLGLYHLPRLIIALLILFQILYLIFCFKKNHRRDLKTALFSLGATVSILLVVNFLKKTTNMHCPYHLLPYGGDNDYLKLFELRKNHPFINYPKGECFPAGHASGGFSLLGCLFYMKKRSLRTLGFFIFSALGMVMGIYQMIRGAHFLSHTLISYLIAITIIGYLWHYHQEQRP